MTPYQKEMVLLFLHKFQTCDIYVRGSSMWPFIHENDLITLKQMKGKLSLGKVVAFFNHNQLIIHRIIWLKKVGDNVWDVWIHGDSSPFSQAKISSEQIIGILHHTKRENRVIKISFQFPWRIFIILLGFFLQTIIILSRKVTLR